MTLPMTRPWKHPKTGIFWLRKVVPAGLRDLVGKVEERKSLHTRDPNEAKAKLAVALVELDEQWANLREGSKPLSGEEAYNLAVPFFETFLLEFRKSGGLAVESDWDGVIGEKLWDSELPPVPTGAGSKALLDWLATPAPHAAEKSVMRDWCVAQAGQCAQTHGLRLDEAGHELLARAIAAAMQRGFRVVERFRADGLPLSALDPQKVSPALPSQQTDTQKQVVSIPFSELVEGWKKEARPVEKTAYSWAKVIDQLREYVGFDDAAQLSADDLIRWKSSLIDAGLKDKTIRDSKLAPVRAILQWGKDNRKLEKNVAERITIDVKGKPSERRRSYTEAEALTVLRAANAQTASYLYWVPWVCAFTGARVSEICQLRAEDVIQEEGVWCLKFTAEAGSLKNESSERVVPIHSALHARNFLAFAQSKKRGPLFDDLKPDRFGSRGGTGTKLIGRWIRALGIIDKRISPNHSWRHRLKTLARRYGLATDIVDAIVGHKDRSVSAGYGEFPMEALTRELEKFQRSASKLDHVEFEFHSLRYPH